MIFAIVSVVLVIIIFLFWLIVIDELGIFGPSANRFFYNITGRGYNDRQAKPWLSELDDNTIGSVVVEHSDRMSNAPVLDACCGTGRVPRSVMRLAPGFEFEVMCLDQSDYMLDQLKSEFGVTNRITPVLHDMSKPLPYPDEFFGVVTCIAALELMPKPLDTLAELTRVLKPGGLLILTNRCDWTGKLMLGRTMETMDMLENLYALGFTQVDPLRWTTLHDLVYALK